MRWVGQLDCDWFAAQLRLDRAESVAEAFDAIRGWLAPTFSLVVGDDAGRIGYHATGAIPIREQPNRAYRDGADPNDQWAGLIPPDGMPHVIDPPAGWIATANNRPAPDDFPYPLSGTWDENHRAKRIGELIEEAGPRAHDLRTFGRIHGDVRSERAHANLPALVAALRTRLGPYDRDADALAILAAWDQETRPDSAGAAIYEVTAARWAQAVAVERFPAPASDFVAAWMNGFAARLLAADEVGWFGGGDEVRLDRLAGAFHQAVAELTEALGPDQATWRWGDLHRLQLRHPLSGRGDLGALLDKPAVPIGGDPGTVHNTGFPGGRIPATSPDYWRNWEASSGCGFRMVADLGDPHGSLWTITGEGQSAHPGSPHAQDQIADFAAVRYREVPLARDRVVGQARHRLVLRPGQPA
jgi:penicillin amidase